VAAVMAIVADVVAAIDRGEEGPQIPSRG